MSFKIGDKVKWSSQASGSTKEKIGEIVRIVPAKMRFSEIIVSLNQSGKKFSLKCDGWSYRSHESYAVFVPTKSGKSNHLYWPIVSRLVKV